MTGPLVAIGGPPGSGKTTAARGVAGTLGLELRSAGDLFRQAAHDRGMDLEAFSRFAEQHPEVDLEIDEAMGKLAEPGRILEGRLVGELLRRRGVRCDWVEVTAQETTRAQRIAGRDRLAFDESLHRMRLREESERIRYARFYGIDLAVTAPDLRLDATELEPAEVVARIVGFVRARPVASG
ncbi:MAG TPA: AAA family ATPase [Thermoplasmata archaeon]|nr:AAA family ATPase [Thermoplasmata archaeon]